jgi:hypothetical protein
VSEGPFAFTSATGRGVWRLSGDREPQWSSPHRFDDGGAFRVEIPSVEGPEALAAVLSEAKNRGVTLHRVSQGSGIAMLTDAEIADMVGLAGDHLVELCLFLGPRAAWDIGASALSSSRGIGARVRGGEQVEFSIDDAVRGVDLGVRSLLVADEGVLWVLDRMRAAGQLPADLRLKMSALSGPGNPAAFRVVEMLGADSINVPSDLTIRQLGQLRFYGRAAMDVYVESPDGLGGFVRHHELPALIAAGAPIYLKFGLRNAPDIYPSGGHLAGVAISTARERVRRAALGLELLSRKGLLDQMSPAGSTSLPALPRFEVSHEPDAVVINGAIGNDVMGNNAP